MKFILLDGTTTKVSIKPLEWPFRPRETSSQLEWECGEYLRAKYPLYVVLAQFTIPGTRMSLDYYVPQLNVAYEVQGEQHTYFNEFFHHSPQEFAGQQQRDGSKSKWCALNHIKLIQIFAASDLT